jgi:hypothetical protein
VYNINRGCFRYIIVNSVHKGENRDDDDDDDDNNNNNNNNNNLTSTVILEKEHVC